MKLSHQFKSGGGGGERIRDTIGPGSAGFAEQEKALTPNYVRQESKPSIRDMLVGNTGIMSSTLDQVWEILIYIQCI